MPRLLIVDDELDICGILAEFFCSKGFSVASAFSGEEALESLEQGPPDIVLLDLNLPGISGIETLRLAKRRFPEVRVIIITAHDEPHLREQAGQLGAEDYITKPFDFSPKTWGRVMAPTILPD